MRNAGLEEAQAGIQIALAPVSIFMHTDCLLVDTENPKSLGINSLN